MKKQPAKTLDNLITSYPSLEGCKNDIEKAFSYIATCYQNGKKLLVCGNGGSAADSEHIVGELMKGFIIKREIPEQDMERLKKSGAADWQFLSNNLQRALPAICLSSQTALTTAFSNDIGNDMVYAQQVYGYGVAGDVFIGISTSGNSTNVVNAIKIARAFGVYTIGMTGEDGGVMNDICDVAIRVPVRITFKVQELHMPVYHALCAMLEEEFFGC
ncbi:MAG: SIS domain-containing protein [Chitinivibrionales bacterium]|nr:SIS domain-containing protein [Chitinivibrionales bacterium]